MLIPTNISTYVLFYGIGLIALFGIGFVFGLILMKEWAEKRVKNSLSAQRNITKGTISEQLAPYLPDFPKDLKTSEAKFIGKPVDFIVFKGMDDKNISEVVFVEVKSGREYKNDNESSLREAIEQKRVKYVPYHIPTEVFNHN